MECGEFLIEIYSEEVETPGSRIDYRRVMLKDIVKVCSSFCCNGTNLLVATRVPWYKENRNAFDL
jgi:hypothetical protein